MEHNRQINENGREVDADDWNTVAALASINQDLVIQELFRPAPFGGSGVAKGIIPYGYFGSNGTDTANAGVVASTGSTNPSLLVYPFRAVIGTFFGPPATPNDIWRQIHSLVAASFDDSATILPTPLVIAPTVTNNRCDLVFAHITIDATTSDTRYIRDPLTEVLSHSTVVTEVTDKIEILVIAGTESGAPARPAIPVDSGLDFYIPLAYVYSSHPSSGAVSKLLIHEVAPVLPISRATGAASLLPANQQWNPTGPIITTDPFSSGIIQRPEAYIPPTMCGKEERTLALRWDGIPKSPAISTVAIMDDSVDWRGRAFKWHAMACHNSGAATFPWSGIATAAAVMAPAAFAVGGLGVAQAIGFGQSFQKDLAAGFSLANGAAVAVIGSAIMSQLSSTVVLFVDMADGKLKVSTTSDPGAIVFVWLESTGPFANA